MKHCCVKVVQYNKHFLSTVDTDGHNTEYAPMHFQLFKG